MNGWIPTGDHITSGKGHADDAYLVMSLNIGGFKGSEGSFQGQAAEIAQLSFVFETNCSTKCAFFFIEVSEYEERQQNGDLYLDIGRTDWKEL
jgi:hypothetical protein